MKSIIFYFITTQILVKASFPIADQDVINQFFSGQSLAKTALDYKTQKQVLQNAAQSGLRNTPANDIEATLTSISNDLTAKISDSITATEVLATAALNSDYKSMHEGYVKNCCELSNTADEITYSSFYKGDVNQGMTCYKGQCQVNFYRALNLYEKLYTSRALSGQPGCNDFVLSQHFTIKCMENTRDRDEGGSWQYFGSESGGYTIFPAYKEDCDKSREYDPRFRPWYINALSPNPLDVVVILDKSGSMEIGSRMEQAKEAVHTIINMLRPTDRIALAAFSDDIPHSTFTGIDCQSNQLSMATSENKEKLHEFLGTVSPGGLTYYSRGLKYAKSFFQSSDSVPGIASDRKSVLIFLSDGLPTDSMYNILLEQKSLMTAMPELVVMTYGLDLHAQILADMANHDYDKFGVYNNGEVYPTGLYTSLDSGSVKRQLGRFYGHVSIRSSSTQVQFTPPYIDAGGMGLMITASKYVESADGHLQGVVGYDITMTYLMNFFSKTAGLSETFYPFLLNAENGNALYHPNLASTESKIDHFDPVHYSYLEWAGSPSDNPIEKILTQGASEAELLNNERYKLVKKDNGFVTTLEYSQPEDPSAKNAFDMKCKKITVSDTDAGFIVCMVEILSQPTFKDINANLISNVPSKFIYHNFTNKIKAKTREMCSHGFRNSIAPVVGAMKFSPRQFLKPKEYMISDVADKNLLDSSTSVFQDYYSMRASCYISEQLDTAWKNQDSILDQLWADNVLTTSYHFGGGGGAVPISVWRYFGSATGSIRVYPAISLPDVYDPTFRPWYKLAMTDPSKTFISAPYVDAFGMGYVVTVTKAVKYDDSAEGVLGVLGTDYFLGQMGQLVMDNLEPCQQQPENCLLLDSTGAVIWWQNFKSYLDAGLDIIEFDHANPGIYDMDKDMVKPMKGSSYIDQFDFGDFDLLDYFQMKNFNTKRYCSDPTTASQRSFIDFDTIPFLASLQTGADTCVGDSRAQICKFPGTNTYLLHLNKYFNSITFGNRPSQSFEKSQESYSFCTNLMQNEIFGLSYTYIPACQGAPPDVNAKSLLGEFTDGSGFTLEDEFWYNHTSSSRLYSQCYDWMAYFQYYAMYPLVYKEPFEFPIWAIRPIVLTGVFIIIATLKFLGHASDKSRVKAQNSGTNWSNWS